MNTLKKFFLVTLLFTLFAEATPTQQEITNIINLAGKQRMLTQKMSKEALLIAKEINSKKNQEELQKTITLFDTTLNALLNGDSKLKLPKTEDKKIRKRIQVVQKLWKEFKPFVNKIAEGHSNRTSLKAIEMGNMPLLSTMNSIVQMYEKKYSSALKQNRATTINLAGKERMLSQKMTKELLLIAHHLESNSYMKSLSKGGKFFKETLFELMQDKKVMSNPHTKEEIREIKKLWDEYQYAIVNTELSKEGLLIFDKKEKEFIQKMTSKLISVATKIDKERYQNDLRASAQEFETILNGLINGDKQLGLVKSNNKEIQKELSRVKSYWKEYKKIIITVDISDKSLKRAMQLNMPILKAMDRAVKLYELNEH
jgi:hypothetical protein